MEKKYKNKFLENLSESYYSPVDGVFGNESMTTAILNVVTEFSKNEIEFNGMKEIYNTYLNYKHNIKKDIRKYIYHVDEAIEDLDENLGEYLIGEKEREEIIRGMINKKEAVDVLISSRIRMEIFGNYINKEYNGIYDFFKKFNGEIEEKLSNSLEYVFTNYSDKEAFNVLNEDLFYFFIKEKSDLEDIKFNNFYKHASKIIKGFSKMSVNKKDYSILENLVKNKGFKEKLLTKRIASFFRSTDYTYYLEEKNNIHDELMSIEDDEYNNGYTRGRLGGYNDGYKDAAEGFDYNPQNNDEYDEDIDNEDE